MFEVTVLFKSSGRAIFECERFKFIQENNKLIAYNVEFGQSNIKFSYIDLSAVDAITYRVIQ